MLPREAQERLALGAQAFGLSLSDDQMEALGRYADLLREWNKKLSLTRITSATAVVDRHFLDSLVLVESVPSGTSLLDVGTGAGFPGAVVALVRPDVRVTLLEAVGKKAAFLRVLTHRLGLRCEVIHGRSEALLASGRTFGAVVSRAVLPLEQWVEHAAPLVELGGVLLAMVAEVPHPLPDQDGFAGPTVREQTLPDGSHRAVLAWRRVS